MFHRSVVLPTVNRLAGNPDVIASLLSASFVVVTGVLTLLSSSTCMAQHHGHPGYYSNPRYYGDSYPNVGAYGVYSAPIIVAPRYYSSPPINSYGVVVPQQGVAMPVDPAPAAVAPATGVQTRGAYQGELRPGMVLPDGAVVISVGPLRALVSPPLLPAPGN